MCIGVTAGVMIASAVLSAGVAYKQTADNREQMEYAAKVDENNAEVSKWQATDALRRGRTDESMSRLKTGQDTSYQMALLAENGVQIDQGSAMRQLSDTEFFGELDALTIRDNARLEAFGYETQQQQYVNQAQANRFASKRNNPAGAFATSILGSATSMYGSYKLSQSRRN